jgi:pre-mRNA-processing factor 17
MEALGGYASDSDAEDLSRAASSSRVAVDERGGKRKLSAERKEFDEQHVNNDLFGLGEITREGRGIHDSDTSRKLLVGAKPEVATDVALASNNLAIRPSDTHIMVNVPYSEMHMPLQGPQDPFSRRSLGAQQNSLNAHIESAVMTDFDFKNQQRTFETLGYAQDPRQLDSTSFVGDADRAAQLSGASAIELRNWHGVNGKQAAKSMKKRRKGAEGDVSIVEGEGAYIGPWGGWEGENIEKVGPSQQEIQRVEQLDAARRVDKAEELAKRREEEARGSEKSQFHGKSLYDYQGRTYMHIPTDVEVNLYGEAGSQESFLPKACIHTWTGHTKAISALRLFPRSGHLLLSSSMDGKVKLWDVYREGSCLRTFMGHSKAVKDVTFSNDGRRFLSAGYDRQIKLWDTETGECLQAFSNGKMPHVVKFHPDEDKQHIFLAGMNDKKIIQYDINSGELTQEYDQHLGAVNTITFVDDNRRFVTTSDDKTMRAWDFDIPVVIKYVADPLMHSMPAVTRHPNGKWLACQSLDSQILVYASDSFRQNRKKAFKGHNVAGYACQIGFSPDGRFVSSGDGSGNLVIWDWKNGHLLKRLRGHKEVVITHEWLPHESSKVVTGSWDGTIKLWD